MLQVHTRYRQAGGEDAVVEAERQLLEDAGIVVRQVLFDNADLSDSQSRLGDLRLAGNAIWSRSAARRVRAAISEFDPQVMHVHNTFAAASPSVYAAAARARVPVVQTLHNYRLVCPAAVAFRGGHVCTDCVGRFVPWPAVKHACIRHSRAQSAVSLATITLHRARGTFDRQIDAYIALTSFQRQVMIDGGLPGERICVIPNFLEPDPGIGETQRAGILYVGRLTIEKGIHELLRAAAIEPGVVRVVGDGPMTQAVRQAGSTRDLEYLGPLPAASVISELKRAVALVLPSIWFEGLPLVVLEAFATGTPVIGTRIGSLAELIDDGQTGLLVEPGDAPGLAERLRWAAGNPSALDRMGIAARQTYETRYRGSAHVAALSQTYSAAVSSPLTSENHSPNDPRL